MLDFTHIISGNRRIYSIVLAAKRQVIYAICSRHSAKNAVATAVVVTALAVQIGNYSAP